MLTERWHGCSSNSEKVVTLLLMVKMFMWKKKHKKTPKLINCLAVCMCEPATVLLQLPVPWGWGFQGSYPRATLILLGDKAWLWWHPALGPSIQPPWLSFLSLTICCAADCPSFPRLPVESSFSFPVTFILMELIGLCCKRHHGS